MSVDQAQPRLPRAAAASIVLVAVIAATGATFMAPSAASAINGGACRRSYDIRIDPANFVDASGQPNRIDNPFFPLAPGTTWVYQGVKDGAPLRDVMTVTGDTRMLMGVRVRVVRDTAYADGLLAEDTFDWYAQDDAGNVWYFGEDTREFDENGDVTSTEGSWEAGQGDNLPGILMLAHPRSGRTYFQEHAPDVAVDMGTVLSRHQHVTVPAGTYRDALMTKEYSCLEPGVEHKFYVAGVGLVAEVGLSASKERTALVSVTP
jgi:hypothetical protein